MCFDRKSPHSLKNGGTDGKQAALSTKSFSMLFQMPISIPWSTRRQSSLTFHKMDAASLTEQLVEVRLAKESRVRNYLDHGECKGSGLLSIRFARLRCWWWLRKAKAHQGHRTDLPPFRHLEAPDNNAWIDGEGDVCECRYTCV